MRRRNQTILSALICCLSGVVSAPTGASTIYVSPGGSESPPYDTFAKGVRTIGGAIDMATDGDHVIIDAGQYDETITVSKSLTIEGQGMGATVLNAGGSGTCLVLSSAAQLQLSNLTLRGGQAEYGGGIDAREAGAVLNGVRITECSAGRGGGIYAEDATVTLTDCIISYCAALPTLGTYGGKGGGAYLVYSPIAARSTFTGCAFYGNVAKYGGAIRLWQGRLLAERCQFFDNRAQYSALQATEVSDVDMVDCLYHHNQSLYGTALEIVDDSQSALCYLTVANNSSRFGADAVFVDTYSDVEVWNCDFQRNTPDSAIFTPGTLVAGSVFSTVPGGTSGIVAESDAFAVGSDGAYYTAWDEANPTVFIGAGSSGCPYAVDDATRKSFVSGPADASPPNAGYAYPLAAEGKVQLSPDATCPLTARGVPYLDYTVESATDAAFTQNAAKTRVGFLAPSLAALPDVVVPETGNAFFRLRGTAPTGRQAVITAQDTTGGVLPGIPVDIMAAETFMWVGTAVTQADGTATVANLPLGEYTALANWNGATYLPTYLGDTTDPDGGMTFALSASQDAFAGTITLQPGAAVAGHVTGGGMALAEARVSAYNADGVVVSSTLSEADGTYSISGLPAGSYRVSAAKSPEYATVYWPSATSIDAGQAISLTGTERKTADFSLSPLPVITGHVTAPADTDLFGIVVVLYEAADYTEATYTFAEADGSFSMHAELGAYVLSAGEGSALVVAFSDEIQLGTGGVDGVNLALVLGATISGYVLDEQQMPLAGIYVDFYVGDGTGGLTWVNTAVTDDGGAYASPVLPPGTYYAQAYGEPVYDSPWYLDAQYAEYAEAIPLDVSRDLAGVSFGLTPK
ncbi:MAG: hypothetical protein HON70_05155 [Lentisphaerae bacterium]|nr:hypothetical protein [Lentisphaerota bacterium]